MIMRQSEVKNFKNTRIHMRELATYMQLLLNDSTECKSSRIEYIQLNIKQEVTTTTSNRSSLTDTVPLVRIDISHLVSSIHTNNSTKQTYPSNIDPEQADVSANCDTSFSSFTQSSEISAIGQHSRYLESDYSAN